MGTLRLISGISFLGGKPERNSLLELEVIGPSQELVLAEEDLIWPGFVDFHLHLGDRDHNQIGVIPADLYRSGVFAAADAGTFGWKNLPALQEGFPYKRWLSLLPYGLLSPAGEPYQGLGSNAAILSTYAANRHQLVGLKIRLGQGGPAEDELLLADGAKIARRLEAPLMVHITNARIPLSDIVNTLQAGDVITHVYHGRQGSILTETGIDPAIATARGKGILLDLGHGSNHFSWKVFEAAHQLGIEADTVSTDLTRNTLDRPPLIGLAHLCSKLHSAGLSWPQLYQATVTRPSEYLQLAMPEGSLAVLRREAGHFHAEDCEQETRTAKHAWRVAYAVYAHRVVASDK